MSNCQFGFRKGCSTDLAIQTLVERYYETIESNETMVGIFLDLSRAFDTISHKILIRKLRYYGIRGIALDWIFDYLNGRTQYVNYNNGNSKMVNITIGVPQGSILGPLLFLLYVNDLSCISPKLSYIQFADDTNIFMTGNSLEDIFNVLNDELKLISAWMRANKLALNLSKTNFMIMSSPRSRININDYKVYIDGHNSEGVNQCKFLGVIIDDKMTWKHHVSYIYVIQFQKE